MRSDASSVDCLIWAISSAAQGLWTSPLSLTLQCHAAVTLSAHTLLLRRYEMSHMRSAHVSCDPDRDNLRRAAAATGRPSWQIWSRSTRCCSTPAARRSFRRCCACRACASCAAGPSPSRWSGCGSRCRAASALSKLESHRLTWVHVPACQAEACCWHGRSSSHCVDGVRLPAPLPRTSHARCFIFPP